MNIDRDTPIWQLTLGDFLQAFQKYTEIPNNPEQEVIEKKEYVLKEDGNIKTYPVMYARNKLTVKKGEKVEKTEELGKWIKVKKDNTIGWILSTEVE